MKQKIITRLQQPCITFSWMSVFLYGLFFILMLITIANKENYHSDEISTFRLANHPFSLPFVTGKKTYIPASQPFLDIMAVSENGRFDYGNVWKNQSLDVHPPLYYVFIHTICSVFYKEFNGAPAATVNIIFALLTLWALRKVVRGLTNDNQYICVVVSIVFILSSGILSTVSFYRMYVVAMFWVTSLSALFIKALNSQKIDRCFLMKFYLIIVFGSLTHYYYIIFAAFICAIFGFYFLCQKRWRSLGAFIGVGLMSLGSVYVIFPAVLKHIFFSYRGKESFSNLTQSFYEYWEILKKFYFIVNTEIFGGIFEYLATGLIGLIIISLIFQKGHSLIPKRDVEKYMLVFIPCLLYFLLIAKISVYKNDRYMFPIYAVMMGSVLSMASTIVLKVIKNKASHVIIVAILLTLVIREYQIFPYHFLYKSSVPFLSRTKKYGDTDCLYVSISWKIQRSFQEVRNYRSVTFIDRVHLDDLKKLDIANQRKLVVSIPNEDNHRAVLKKVMSEYPQLTRYRRLGSFSWTTSYYLFGDK